MGDGSREHRQHEVSEVLQRYSAVSDDLGRAFGSRYNMHHTAARAISELMAAERAGTRMSAGELGTALSLTPASMTGLIDRLVGAGHVRREPHPSDRRRIMLAVEPAAQRLAEEFFRPLADDLSTVWGRYSVEELDLIDDFLTRATAAVERHLDRH